VIICYIGSDSYLVFGLLAVARLRFSNIFGDFGWLPRYYKSPLSYRFFAWIRRGYSNFFFYYDYKSSSDYSCSVLFSYDYESDNINRDYIRKKQNNKVALRPISAARLVYLGSS
jgi:hypothetical protein